jgi:hypothetical protein
MKGQTSSTSALTSCCQIEAEHGLQEDMIDPQGTPCHPEPQNPAARY